MVVLKFSLLFFFPHSFLCGSECISCSKHIMLPQNSRIKLCIDAKSYSRIKEYLAMLLNKPQKPHYWPSSCNTVVINNTRNKQISTCIQSMWAFMCLDTVRYSCAKNIRIKYIVRIHCPCFPKFHYCFFSYAAVWRRCRKYVDVDLQLQCFCEWKKHKLYM